MFQEFSWAVYEYVGFDPDFEDGRRNLSHLFGFIEQLLGISLIEGTKSASSSQAMRIS